MKTNYVLVDYENVQVSNLSLLKGKHFRVWLFLGPKNATLKTELVLAMNELHERPVLITMETSGKDALDFHIAYYVGTLSKEDPDGFFHIISRDKGYDPLLQHLKARHIHAYRSESIEGMRCFPPAKQECKKTQLELVIADHRKRKASKPRRLKTLNGTIREVCGKETPESRIHSLIQALVMENYLKVEGTKVQYSGL